MSVCKDEGWYMSVYVVDDGVYMSVGKSVKQSDNSPSFDCMLQGMKKTKVS